MKIKGFLCLILTIAMLMGVCSFSVAAYDFMIFYSFDNETWLELPHLSLSNTTKNYVINLPDNTDHVYIDYEMNHGEGTTNVETRNAGVTGKGSYAYTITGDLTAPGTTVTDAQGLFPTYGHKFLLPIKGNGTETWTKYTDRNTTYNIIFKSKQPKITSYTSLIKDVGTTSFIGGGQVNNDNMTLIDSATPASPGNIWALANVSKKLLSSSALLLPISAFESSECSEDVYPTLATFKTDTPCRVYVMRPSAVTTSAYNTWDILNNGTQGIDSGSEFTTPRNDNSYTNTDYYGMAYKWVPSEKGANMIKTPGISGTITSSAVVATSHLNYVYSKSFSAGETITIGNPGGLGGSEASAPMTVLVKWDLPDPTVTVTELSATSEEGKTTLTATNTFVNPTPNKAFNYEAIAVIYSDSTCKRLIDVATVPYTEGPTEWNMVESNPGETINIRTVTIIPTDTETVLEFKNADYNEGAYVQFMVWEMDELKPISLIAGGLLSEITK